VQVRDIRPDEYEVLGALTLEAYTTLDGHVNEAEYEAELQDVATRAEAAATAVLVAADEDSTILGGITYIGGPSSPFAEHDEPDTAAIRMLAVANAAQRRGVGEALVQACLDRARAEGQRQVVLHSTTWMHTAHRLYERLGFERDTTLDWTPVPQVPLLGYRLRLDEHGSTARSSTGARPVEQ
jgi:ribosomal protein S18 acetylase RimI-like enzyme